MASEFEVTNAAATLLSKSDQSRETLIKFSAFHNSSG
jgi:hypothetical protein